jgi:hypothetical protein
MFEHVDPRLFQRRPFLGVRLGAVSLAFWSPVGDVVSRRRSYLAGGGFVFPPKTELQQSVDEGPASYRQLMILCTFLPLLSIFWMVRFWPKWREQVKRSENPTTLSAPYTPSAF